MRCVKLLMLWCLRKADAYPLVCGAFSLWPARKSLVKIAGERVLLERITGEIPGLGSLTLGGGYGFAGDLDFQGDLLLDRENSAKLLGSFGGLTGTLGNLLGREEQPIQRLALPVKIRGTWSKPDVVIDFAALTRDAGEDLTDELKGRLEGLFKR